MEKELIKFFKNNNEDVWDENYFRPVDKDIVNEIDIYSQKFHLLLKDIDKNFLLLKEIIFKKISGKYAISYSPFPSFCSTYNLTLDLLKSISDENLKNIFIEYSILFKTIIENIENIHQITLALYLSKNSQTKGVLGQRKIEKQLIEAGYSKANNLNELKVGFFTTNESLITDFLIFHKIELNWIKKEVKKKPDFLFIGFNEKIYLGEHKNLKEPGGAQDKQMLEVMNLVGEKNSDLILIGYVDGNYQNILRSKLNSDSKRENKQVNQILEILKNIEINNNYFVDTNTFSELLKRIAKDE